MPRRACVNISVPQSVSVYYGPLVVFAKDVKMVMMLREDTHRTRCWRWRFSSRLISTEVFVCWHVWLAKGQQLLLRLMVMEVGERLCELLPLAASPAALQVA